VLAHIRHLYTRPSQKSTNGGVWRMSWPSETSDDLEERLAIQAEARRESCR